MFQTFAFKRSKYANNNITLRTSIHCSKHHEHIRVVCWGWWDDSGADSLWSSLSASVWSPESPTVELLHVVLWLHVCAMMKNRLEFLFFFFIVNDRKNLVKWLLFKSFILFFEIKHHFSIPFPLFKPYHMATSSCSGCTMLLACTFSELMISTG